MQNTIHLIILMTVAKTCEKVYLIEVNNCIALYYYTYPALPVVADS